MADPNKTAAAPGPTPVAKATPKPPAVKAARPSDPPAPPPATERKNILDVQRLREAEHERLIWCCYPPASHTIEDLKRPEYWASVAPKLRPWNHIEAYAEDGTWYAELLVLAVERSHAIVHVLNEYQLSSSDVALTQLANAGALSKYEIKHTPNLEWHVVRRADGHIVKDHLHSRDQAYFTLQEHLKAVT